MKIIGKRINTDQFIWDAKQHCFIAYASDLSTWLTNVHQSQAARAERELSVAQEVFVTMPRATDTYTSQQLFKIGMVAIYRVDKE